MKKEEEEGGSAPLSPASKRNRRVAKACDQCWKLHRRCYGPRGETGRCERCDRLDKQCTWDENADRLRASPSIRAKKSPGSPSSPGKKLKRTVKLGRPRKTPPIAERSPAWQPDTEREVTAPPPPYLADAERAHAELLKEMAEACQSLAEKHDVLLLAVPLHPAPTPTPASVLHAMNAPAPTFVPIGPAQLHHPPAYANEHVAAAPHAFLAALIEGLRLDAASEPPPFTPPEAQIASPSYFTSVFTTEETSSLSSPVFALSDEDLPPSSSFLDDPTIYADNGGLHDLLAGQASPSWSYEAMRLGIERL